MSIGKSVRPFRSCITPIGIVLLLTNFAFLNPCANAEGISNQDDELQILFLGDQGHHQPAARFAQLQPVLERRGIRLTYTEDMADLNEATLSEYDGLLIYANINRIEPDQETALVEFVENGNGLVPVHCASYCFLNSDRYVALVGAQFQRHGTGTFRTELTNTDHPVMQGFGGFESWDETYVHHRHNEENRTILSYRAEGDQKEPWTWVRTHGEGRVFYTAWGHDHRTWAHEGFHNLIERGIRWAVRDESTTIATYQDPSWFPVPAMQALPDGLAPFEYDPANVPFYPPSEQWGVIGEAITQMQRPLPPEESMKHYSVPEGFRLDLFAAEPDIKKPICMNWDERGRLWVAETIDYPNEKQPDGSGRDRITICEDTDGDGRADQFTVFAEQLSIPTSIVFANGGVIVHQAPETLFLKDTDGDDVADIKEVLFRGWSVGDTHAGPSNMHYGLDNWIWGIVGYAGFRGTIGDVSHGFQTGFYRFKPDGSEMEFLRNTNNNSWGVGFNEEGVLFGSTANRNPSVYMPIPNRYYEQVRGWSSSVLGSIADDHYFDPITEKVRQVDQHGGYTAAAGHALYTARAWPKEYWNRTAFVTGSTGHLVGTFVLTPDGSDFRSTSPFNILAGDDEWAAPIMAEVGPDGQVWVIDWYNYIVQHNPTPSGYQTGRGNAYETDLRDKRHGRVYRIVFNESPSYEPVNLSTPSDDELLAALSHTNLFWRRHAQRIIVEEQKVELIDGLVELTRDQSVDEIGLNVGAIHALWSLHGIGGLEADPGRSAAIGALKHPSAGVRLNAYRVLSDDRTALLASISEDDSIESDAQARLWKWLAIADASSGYENPNTETAIIEALLSDENMNDRWIPDALVCAAARCGNGFLRTVLEYEFGTGDRPNRLDQLIRTQRIVAEHVIRGESQDRLDGLFASMVGAQQPVVQATIDGIVNGWSDQRPVELTVEDEAAMLALVERLPAGLRGSVVVLARRMGSERLEEYAGEIAADLLEKVEDENLDEAERLDAARRLIEFTPDDLDMIGRLLNVISARISLDFSTGIISAIRTSDNELVADILLLKMDDWTPATKKETIRALLGRPAWSNRLLLGIERGDVSLNDLALDQRQALASHPDRRIAARMQRFLSMGGGSIETDRSQILEELAYVAEQSGDPTNGKLIFDKQCAKCHMHRGEGTAIGPDLSGMAVHPKEELLTQILDPSRSVEGNYRSYTVLTLDGIVINGLLASETRTTIELFDTEGEKHIVLREDIDEMNASDKSLMPEGFEDELEPDELSDLLSFLTQRGQYVPIPIDRAATIVSTKGMFFTEESTTERLIFSDWSPKEFAGVPFVLVNPQGDRVPNVIMLNGPNGQFPPRMPRQVSVPVSGSARAIHLLSGVSGWGAQRPRENGPISMIVRLHYSDGSTEDHALRDGHHFADYIGQFDVPGSELAFKLRNQQIRYLAIEPERADVIDRLEFVKGEDRSAPIVMAVTIESNEE